MRLIDEIRTGTPLSLHAAWVPPAEWVAFVEMLRPKLDALPVIVADNVDQFFTEKLRDTQQSDIVLAREFPNAVPPFPEFWIEWTPADPEWRSSVQRFGVYVIGTRTETGWTLDLAGFLRGVDANLVVMAGNVVRIKSDSLGNCQTIQASALNVHGVQAHTNDLLWCYYSNTALLTMCFMNCRNVKVSWIEQPKAWVKSFAKKHSKLPTRRIGTVEITPMTKLIAEGTHTAETSERRRIAAHLCRGHFKHYGADSKLFGKHEGTYFWGAVLRNPNASRDVEHEYRINTRGKDK